MDNKDRNIVVEAFFEALDYSGTKSYWKILWYAWIILTIFITAEYLF